MILDLSNFAAQIPFILGTPKISCIMNVIKEREIDASFYQQGSWQAECLLAFVEEKAHHLTLACTVSSLATRWFLLSLPWVNARAACLLVVWQATATVEDDKVTTGKSDASEYDQVVATKDTRPLMSSHPMLHMQGWWQLTLVWG